MGKGNEENDENKTIVPAAVWDSFHRLYHDGGKSTGKLSDLLSGSK